MSRVFLYSRVSTRDQHTSNQVQEVANAGFNIEPHRIVEEKVSGGVPATQRTGFAKLLERMEAGDVLVVTKLDRLGRDVIDVMQTVAMLEAKGIKVHCFDLGGADLTSAAGRMTLGVLAAVAGFERDRLIERTQSGLARAKAEGVTLGRPPAASAKQVQALKAQGLSQSKVAAELDVSLSTVKRLWNK